MTVHNPKGLLAERLAAQLLAGNPAPDPASVVSRLLAVQAQDLRGARLAMRARTSRLTSARIDRAFTEDRSIVITWLNRGTLHLVRSDDYSWLHSLTAPVVVSANARRLHQEGVSARAAERGVAIIRRSLENNGPLTRQQIGDHLRAGRVRVEGQALVHLLLLASHRGVIVRGPMIGPEQAFVLTRDWLGETKPIERDVALAELAHRYLAGHGPATDRDLAYWSGLALRDARAGLKAIGSQVIERGDGVLSLKGRRSTTDRPPPRLLGSFDPLLFGWTSREPVLGAHGAAVVSGGVFRPFAIVDGRAAATWTIGGGDVTIKPFRSLSRQDASALKTEANDVLRFIKRNEQNVIPPPSVPAAARP
jgi:hypothetical protein